MSAQSRLPLRRERDAAHPESSAGRRDFVAELVDDLARLDALGGELDALHERTGAPASARWAAIHAGMKHDPAARPWCVVVREGSTIVAAALATARPRRRAWAIRSATHPDEPGWLAAIDTDASAALADGLAWSLDRIGRPWRLEWRHLPAGDPTLASLRQVLPVATVQASAEDAQLACDAGVGPMPGLSRNTRSAVRRAHKRIAAAGLRCELAWLRDVSGIAANLDAVVGVHQDRNRQLRGSAGLDDPAQRALFEETVRAQAGAGRARLLTLRLSGDLAAFAICFEASGTLHVYSNMASPDWLDFSPGTIANAEVVLAASRDPGLRAIDWGTGLQRYKLSGTHVHVEHLAHLQAWSSLACRLAWTLRDRLLRR